MHKYLNKKCFTTNQKICSVLGFPSPGIQPLYYEWGLDEAGSSWLFEHGCLKVSLCYPELRWVDGVGQEKCEKDWLYLRSWRERNPRLLAIWTPKGASILLSWEGEELGCAWWGKGRRLSLTLQRFSWVSLTRASPFSICL